MTPVTLLMRMLRDVSFHGIAGTSARTKTCSERSVDTLVPNRTFLPVYIACTESVYELDTGIGLLTPRLINSSSRLSGIRSTALAEMDHGLNFPLPEYHQEHSISRDVLVADASRMGRSRT